jgi:hypothetical protein
MRLKQQHLSEPKVDQAKAQANEQNDAASEF